MLRQLSNLQNNPQQKNTKQTKIESPTKILMLFFSQPLSQYFISVNLTQIHTNDQKKGTRGSTFHFHFVTGERKKKKHSAAEEGKVFVNWKISSLKKKKTPSIYIPPKPPSPFMPSLLSISKLLLRASGGMITERRGL